MSTSPWQMEMDFIKRRKVQEWREEQKASGFWESFGFSGQEEKFRTESCPGCGEELDEQGCDLWDAYHYGAGGCANSAGDPIRELEALAALERFIGEPVGEVR